MERTKPLRLVGVEDAAKPRARKGPWDLGVFWPTHDVERAIDDVQLRIDELRSMLHPTGDDDRPKAA